MNKENFPTELLLYKLISGDEEERVNNICLILIYFNVSITRFSLLHSKAATLLTDRIIQTFLWRNMQ